MNFAMHQVFAHQWAQHPCQLLMIGINGARQVVVRPRSSRQLVQDRKRPLPSDEIKQFNDILLVHVSPFLWSIPRVL